MNKEHFVALEKYFRFNKGTDNCPIMLTPREGREHGRAAIAKAMNDLGFKRGVEIGTRYGVSAKIWCDNIPGLKLTCVDPYTVYHVRRDQAKQDRIYKEACERLAPFDVEMVRETSFAAVDRFEDGSLDFVNIDGDHTFDVAAIDIIQYVPKVREGGLVLIHDYCAFQRSGVMPAVDSYTSCHRIDPWFVTRDYEPTAFWMKGVEKA